jgi:hypothetical protein
MRAFGKAAAVSVIGHALLATATAADGDLGRTYSSEIHPLVAKTCGGCHGARPKDNDLDLVGLATADAVLARPAVLEHVIERLHVGDMPPREAPQPSDVERQQLLGWFTAALEAEAAARAGDPGPVMLRRLTNVEYDNAVRDLTGVDMRPTQAREFPPDAVGGEGFANVGEAMPVSPVLVKRYLQAARDVAARAVLLPTGFRFSASTDRPAWTAAAEEALRAFHARHGGPNGEPPLERHLAATLRHRERLTKEGAAALAAVAAEEKLNPVYLTALWTGLTRPSAVAAEEAPQRAKEAAVAAIKQKINAGWTTAKRVLAEAKVAEKGEQSFEQKVTIRRGELLVLTVSPNGNYGQDTTKVEWTISEMTGEKRSWSVADLISDLKKGNPWRDAAGDRWSFLETTTSPTFLTNLEVKQIGQARVQAWSLGSEPAVFVNSADAAAPTLPARSFFVHPGNKRLVAVAWTSPIDAEVSVVGRLADMDPSSSDGVAFELSHIAAPDTGPALAELGKVRGTSTAVGPRAAMPVVRSMWREATTDVRPLLQTIKTFQDGLFQNNYGKNNVQAVGNGMPVWEELLRVVADERVEGYVITPIVRLVARQVAPLQPGTFVIWDRLRLEGGGAASLVLAEQPELRAAIEARGLRFGHHPLGRPVPPTALVTEAPAEVVVDLTKLPAELLKTLAVPRIVRADVRLDEGSPESATVQALLLGDAGKPPTTAHKPGGPLVLQEPEPRVAQIVHRRVVADRSRPTAEFRELFPPALFFAPLTPRDAQGSTFLYRRYDAPLQRLMLDEAGRAELERLWAELHLISEDAVSNRQMYEANSRYYRVDKGPASDFFFIPGAVDLVEQSERELRAAQAAAEPRQLEQLVSFAARAWRRPLADEERAALLAGYRADRADGMEHEPAFRAALARVLASPWFLFRVEEPARGPRWQPVTGLELATRLSFLVWDSIPDDELLAAAPRLHEPAVLEAQLRRMLEDRRARGMAEEFGARWLGVRDFVANHGRSVKDFPEFTPAVRDALAEEPVRWFEDMLVSDRPVVDLIAADAVVVNDVLAKHYGIPGVSGPEWRRVEKVAAAGRGGLLGLGAVLSKHCAASRTSPIKRGAWVAHMLGERLPNPPPDVPPLPETPPAGLTSREITEFHTKDSRCSGCHSRIDPYGMSLERFDALGRLRPAAALKQGESRAALRDGTVLDDVAGLRDYIAGPRRDDFLRSLARKLTGYALGRATLPSDRALVDSLTKTMAAGGRWSDILLVLVKSEQFRCIRPAASATSTSR